MNGGDPLPLLLLGVVVLGGLALLLLVLERVLSSRLTRPCEVCDETGNTGPSAVPCGYCGGMGRRLK